MLKKYFTTRPMLHNRGLHGCYFTRTAGIDNVVASAGTGFDPSSNKNHTSIY